MVPSRRAEHNGAGPSANETDPVGEPDPGAFTVTVEDRVTGSPTTAGFAGFPPLVADGFDVVVLSWFTVTGVAAEVDEA